MNKLASRTALALAASAALALPGAALAQDYQFEGGVSYLDISPDVGSSDSAFGLDLAWYFEPVRTGGLPLAEAAFYTRANNLAFSWLTFDKADVDVIGLGGEFYFNRFYLSADYLRFSNGSSSDDFVIGVGYVPVDGLRLAVRYEFADIGDDAFSLEAKYLAPLAGGTAFGIEAIAEFIDDFADTMALSIAGDYYFNPSLSLGARLIYTDNDFDSDTAWGFGAKYFFTPTISGEVEYINSDFFDTIGIRFAARF